MITPRHYSRPRRQLEVQEAYEGGRILERVLLGGFVIVMAVAVGMLVAGGFHHATVEVAALFPH